MSDEDELRIPEAWAAHLDGRPGGRLSVARADLLLEDPYADFDGSERGYTSVIRDRRDAAYTYVAELPSDEALARLEELAPLGSWMDAAEQRAAAEAMSVLPTDAAFDALLDRATQTLHAEGQVDQLARNERHFGEALLAACARFPRRAVRRLAPRALGRGKSAERYRALLSAAARRDPETARAALAELEDDPRAVVAEILEAPQVPVAPPEALPPVLRAPPWLAPKKKPKPKPIALEPLALPAQVVWRGDERERWLAEAPPIPSRLEAAADEAAWRAAAERCLREGSAELVHLLRAAPLPIAREIAAKWRPRSPRVLERTMGGLVARLELDALPLAIALATAKAAKGVPLLLPLGAPALVPIIGAALSRASTRDAATAWVARHEGLAAAAAIPEALGPDARRRRPALELLGHLVRSGRRGAVEAAARRYGDAALDELAFLLEADPLDDFPKRLPSLPSFYDPAIYPAPELRDGRGALSVEAIEHLGTMLAFSAPGAVYAGVWHVAEACTPASMAAFAWALFESWLSAGADPKHRWAFFALGWLGDDAVAHRLASQMRDWPRRGAARRAELGLDVLAEMRSDVALVLVHRMAEKGRGSLRKNAARKLSQIAAIRQLSEEQLADRLVPTLDLGDDGTMRLDYGSRAFVVGFDQELRPFVRDERGAPLRALPRPGKKDDPDRAPEAERAFKALKKNVRTVAASQLTRFERALATERRWSIADFEAWIVRHPLLVHLARRLVWARYEDDAFAEAFRVCEDRTYADRDDESLTLAVGEIGLAHPLELGVEATRAWSGLFEDYELLQPFPQLAREVYAVPDGMSAEAYAREHLGRAVEAGRLIALEQRGWVRGHVEDGGRWSHVERPLGRRTALLTFSPGVLVGAVLESEQQTLEALIVREGSGVAPLSALSPVLLSELLRDIAGLGG